LIERLQEAIHFGHRLALLSAPVGFGKTTLLSEWLAAADGAMPPAAVAWISLDEGDNDLYGFPEYTVAALRTLAPKEVEGTKANLGAGLLAALQASRPPSTEAILSSLINEIALVPASTFIQFFVERALSR
jgi:LuxR family maltose regulon positive regulatory protein